MEGTKKRGNERAVGTEISGPTRILKEGGTFLFFSKQKVELFCMHVAIVALEEVYLSCQGPLNKFSRNRSFPRT